MSLINNVDAIINTKKSVDDIGYYDQPISYESNIDVKNILKKPAKNSSLTTRKELEVVANATKNRSLKELDLVYVADKDPLLIFYDFLKSKSLQFDKSTFDVYWNILEQYVYALKYYFNRARPEQIARYYGVEIKVLHTDTHHTPSYPSCHAMYADLAYKMLAEEYPEYKEDFLRISDYCAFARVLQGVHYPSDNVASRKAVSIIYPVLKEHINEYERSQKFPSATNRQG